MENQFNIKLAGWITIVLYALLFSLPIILSSYLMEITWLVGLMIVITIITTLTGFEVLTKTFMYFYKDEEYELSIYTKAAFFLTLGILFLYYGAVSKIWQRALRPSKELYRGANTGYVLSAVLTFGIFFLYLAIFEYTLKRGLKDVLDIEEETLTESSKVLLVILSILTLGLIWFMIYYMVAIIEFVSKRISHTYFGNEIKLTQTAIVWLVIISLQTNGMVWLSILMTLGLLQLTIYGYHRFIKPSDDLMYI